MGSAATRFAQIIVLFVLGGLAVLLCLGVAACGGTHAAGGVHSSFIDPTRLNKEGLYVRQLDLNHDGRPDVFKYFKPVADPRYPGNMQYVLVLKEMDLNFDGKIDAWKIYKLNGELFREYFDLDARGKVTCVNFYEGNFLVRKEFDLNGDGQPDVWYHYVRGMLVRKEKGHQRDRQA